MQQELKNCPFCGSKAKLGYCQAYSVDSSYSYVGCNDCEAQIPYNEQRKGEEEATIKQWNTRATQPTADTQGVDGFEKAKYIHEQSKHGKMDALELRKAKYFYHAAHTAALADIKVLVQALEHCSYIIEACLEGVPEVSKLEGYNRLSENESTLSTIKTKYKLEV